jgi:phosphatidylserine/phosphatidylglycerophosphate/cardiolipin synthase-like enzyme
MHHSNLLLKVGEVTHNDGLKGNFMIVDGTSYSYYLIENDSTGKTQNIIQSFHTQVKPFVETQQHLFDVLASRSVTAKEKIREIGRGIKGDFIDFIQTPHEIKNITTELIESATFEMLLLFSTTNSFYRAEYSGILNSLWQASERGVTVKLLIQGGDDDNRLKEIIQNTVKQTH